MKKCDFIGCDSFSTVEGFIYGHERNTDKPDSFLPVFACDIHAQRDDFFEKEKQKN